MQYNYKEDEYYKHTIYLPPTAHETMLQTEIYT
jgi:hypothetical protein